MLYIRSPKETYSVDDLNHIYRTRAGGFDYDMAPSEHWKLIGAVEYHMAWGVCRILRHFTIDQIRAEQVPWLYQNRKQRCYLVDKDRGATRVWMSPTPYTLQVLS